MGFRSDQGGRDGVTMDGHEFLTNFTMKSTTIQGRPQNLSATARCDQCGTSDQLAGRPGQRINTFKCRTCKTDNVVNNGQGFTFQSWN